MSSSTQLWEAWILSKQLNQTPAQVYFLEDPFTAWCFNRAVVMFGMAVEQDIQESTEKAKTTVESKRKAKRTLDKWLREPAKEGEGPKFRDPGAK